MLYTHFVYVYDIGPRKSTRTAADSLVQCIYYYSLVILNLHTHARRENIIFLRFRVYTGIVFYLGKSEPGEMKIK